MYEDIIGLIFFLISPFIIWVVWAYMVESPANKDYRISQANKQKTRKKRRRKP